LENYDNLKGNSNKAKEAAAEEKPAEKAISGPAKLRKKSEVEKIADTFLTEDRHKARDHIIYDLLVPAVKNFVIDMVTVMLKGETPRERDRSRTIDTVSYRPYDKYYDRRNDPAPISRRAFSFDDVELTDREDAETVLDMMNDMIFRSGYATVANLYEYSGMKEYITYTMSRYGWTDLRDATIQLMRNGHWLIKMPPVSPIKMN
jgi:hypothetical protein